MQNNNSLLDPAHFLFYEYAYLNHLKNCYYLYGERIFLILSFFSRQLSKRWNFYLKVYAIAGNRPAIFGIVRYGGYLLSACSCHFDYCVVDRYLDQLEILLEAENHSRVNFIDLTVENFVIFTVIDQLQKRFGTNLLSMENEQKVNLVKFETGRVIAFSKLIVKKEDIVTKIIEMEHDFI